MTPEEREKELRVIEAMLSKTVDNGATEEEAATAYAMAQVRMEKLAITEAEVRGLGDKQAKMVTRVVNVRHPTAPWRFSLIAAVGRNTGVYCVRWRHGGKSSTGVGTGEVHYFGHEIMAEGAALCAEYLVRAAEYLVRAAEALSEDYVRRTGGGQTARRQYAQGAAMRLQKRVQESFNLASDPKLPLVISQSYDLAKSEYPLDVGTAKAWGKNISIHTVMGYAEAEKINLRGHQEKAKLS